MSERQIEYINDLLKRFLNYPGVLDDLINYTYNKNIKNKNILKIIIDNIAFFNITLFSHIFIYILERLITPFSQSKNQIILSRDVVAPVYELVPYFYPMGVVPSRVYIRDVNALESKIIKKILIDLKSSLSNSDLLERINYLLHYSWLREVEEIDIVDYCSFFTYNNFLNYYDDPHHRYLVELIKIYCKKSDVKGFSTDLNKGTLKILRRAVWWLSELYVKRLYQNILYKYNINNKICFNVIEKCNNYNNKECVGGHKPDGVITINNSKTIVFEVKLVKKYIEQNNINRLKNYIKVRIKNAISHAIFYRTLFEYNEAHGVVILNEAMYHSLQKDNYINKLEGCFKSEKLKLLILNTNYSHDENIVVNALNIKQ